MGDPSGPPLHRSAPSLYADLGVDRKLRGVLAAFLVLIGSIVAYNAHAIGAQRGAALAINVMARQRSLAERYIKDVLLVIEGYPADPRADALLLSANLHGLMKGGKVQSVQGADREILIAAVTDGRVVAQLREEQRLLDELIRNGNRLMATPPASAGFDHQVLTLRVNGAQLSSISNDAVGQMTRDAETSFGHLVVVGVALGLLGAIAAVGMGLMLRRAGAQQSAKFRSLVQGASDLITVVDGQGRVVFQSPSIERLLGIRAEELPGTLYAHLADPDSATRLHAVVRRLLDEPSGAETVEYRLRHRDGSWRDVESIATNLMADSTIQGIVLNTRDVTERTSLEAELSHQAFHDSLTGLANRALFHDRVDHALARTRRDGDAVALLLLDLDGFKTVNDSLGHDVGDELLVAVALRIKACLRGSDTVARLGGDEFAVLMEDQDDDDRAVDVAERLLSVLAERNTVRGHDVFIGASIGIAMDLDALGETAELIRNADTAMYAAKGLGGARWELFKPAMHQRAVRRLELQTELQGALARGEFVVYYQPIVDLATGAVEGTEALLRWHHPARGVVMPNDFIPVAEETGLMVPIGNWVLKEACRQTVAWRVGHRSLSGLSISVNLSARQLAQPDLIAQVQGALDATGLVPDALILEITEGTLMQDAAETALKVRGLKKLGARIAIDDFGTGASSLGHISNFPVDVLKIDKSFVDRLTGATTGSGIEGSALVEAIIDLARTLRMSTVAEGIEVPRQLAELQTVGCASGQGFLFARPLPPEEIEAYLRSRAPAALRA